VRIAIVGPYFFPQNYGIEKVMLNHARHLTKRGHEVTVVTSRLAYPKGEFRDLPDREIVEQFTVLRLPILVRSLPAKLGGLPSRSGLYVRGLARCLAAVDPDIVHAHNIGAPAWSAPAAKFCVRRGRKFFYSLYYHYGRMKFDWIRKLPIRRMNEVPLEAANNIFLQTKYDEAPLLNDFKIRSPERLAVLENGVDPPSCVRRERRDDETIRLLFVGRVDDARKGFHVLEAALEMMSAGERAQIQLRVVGTISESRRIALQGRFGSLVSIAGNVSEAELEAAYAGADIFIMPSMYEGFGMPYIEAMRYGVAVIGTKAGGVPYVVPASAGLLVEPGNAAALKDAITRMMSERSFVTFGEAGKIWSKGFEWPNVIDKLEAFYDAPAALRRP
jgi:glycosyltransferase involved in cell wall biosynthesis